MWKPIQLYRKSSGFVWFRSPLASHRRCRHWLTGTIFVS
jgi:hypothetical protein